MQIDHHSEAAGGLGVESPIYFEKYPLKIPE